MADRKKHTSDHLSGLAELRRRVEELEIAEAGHKKTEEDLYQSRQMLQLVLDTIPQRVFWKRLDFSYLGCNRPFANDGGIDDANLIIGKNDFELGWKDVAQLYRDDDRTVMETNTPKLNFEEPQTRLDGSQYWLRTSKVPLHDRNGNVIGILGTYEDITERKQIEEALRKERLLLRTLIDNLPDAIYAKDTSCRKTLANLADVHNMGLHSEAEVLGKDDFELYPKEVAEAFFADDQSVLQSGQPVLDREEYLFDENGEKRWLLTSKLPLLDERGQVAGLIGIGRDVTDWKRAEDALRESEARYRSIFENSLNAVLLTIPDGRILAANLEACRILGRTEEEICQIGRSGVVDTTDPRLPAALEERTRTGRFNGELTLVRKDGTKFPAEVATSTFSDKNGDTKTSMIIRDITDRKRAEEALRQSEERYKRITQAVTDYIYTVRVENGRPVETRHSEGCIAVTGYTSGQFAADPYLWYRMVVDQDRAAVEDQARRQLAGEDVPPLEHRIVRKDGATRWVRNTMVQHRDESGKLLSYDGLVQDITDRKLVEKELAASEKNYRELVENALVGVFKTDISGEILYANKAMAEMFEYKSVEEIDGPVARDLYKNPDDVDRFIEHIKKFGKFDSWELELLTKTGKVKNVLISASLDGNIISGMMKDITDIRTLEREFIQTQKLEGLGNIAAGIAHDFNNILGIILGYAELLKRRGPDPERFETGMKAIIDSGARGKILVNQLLMFARKTEITFTSVQVNQIISEIAKVLEETFPRTIKISTELLTGLPHITADANQIHQVLLNICVNARDAMPRGGALSISTSTVSNDSLIARHPEAAASQYVEMQVSDTGIGMDETTRIRIFDPFFTTKDVGKGSGLGLSVVFGIVQNHRGFIEVNSKLGEGTTFSIYFPVQEQLAEQLEPVKEYAEEVSGGTETVLVIEDEQMLRELARSILGSNGYEVITAQDGEEGVEIFRNNKSRIAIVISDLGLPKLSGEEVVGRIKQIDPRAKIIIASGYIDHEVRSKLENSGVRDFVQKPYMMKEVLGAVRNAIDAGG